jgi:hypothetical protein
MPQRFIATEKFEFSNGAIGWRPSGPMDCLGPYAKVQNCPVRGIEKRYTCYASGYPDTYWSIPAETNIHGAHIKGYFMVDREGGIEFIPYDTQYEKIIFGK